MQWLMAFVRGFIRGYRGPQTVEDLVSGTSPEDEASARLVSEWLAAQEQVAENTVANLIRRSPFGMDAGNWREMVS